MKHVAALLIAAGSLAHTGAEQRHVVKSGQVELGSLLQSEWQPDCGCAFRDANDNSSMLAFWAVDEPAHMFINGDLRTLKVTEHFGSTPVQLGDPYSAELTGPDIQATVEATTTFVCPKEQESCEVTRYKGRLVVRSGTSVGSFQITGDCGC
jgi:hypothetical protein